MAGPNEEAEEGADTPASESQRDPDAVWWEAMVEEQELVADERREAGWAVGTIEATETAVELPEAGESSQFGLVHSLSDDAADELAELLEDTVIDEFEAYRRTVDTTCFLLTELRDTGNERCVLVAGVYDVNDAEALADHAAEVGHLFSRFQRPDGAVVAAVRHDAYEKLLPPSLTE